MLVSFVLYCLHYTLEHNVLVDPYRHVSVISVVSHVENCVLFDLVSHVEPFQLICHYKSGASCGMLCISCRSRRPCGPSSTVSLVSHVLVREAR